MLDTTADIPWDLAFPPLTSDNVDNDRRLAPLADPFGSPCSSITREGLHSQKFELELAKKWISGKVLRSNPCSAHDIT